MNFYEYICKVPVQHNDHYGNPVFYESNSEEIQRVKEYMETCDFFLGSYNEGMIRELYIYPMVDEPNYLYFKLKLEKSVETEEEKKDVHKIIKDLEWVVTTMAEFWIDFKGDFEFVSIEKLNE